MPKAKETAAKPAGDAASDSGTMPPEEAGRALNAATSEDAVVEVDIKTTRKSAAAKRAAKAPAAKKPDPLGFVSLDEVEEAVNILWYGREGTGKTTDLASMANLGRTLLVNAEAGLHKGPLRKRGIDTSNLVIYPKPGQPITFEGLEQLHYQIANELADDPKSWAGVGFDSLTEIHKALLEGVTAVARDKAARKGQERDRWFTERGDYGVMTEQMRVLLRRFRDLPCHFGATALERRDTDDDTGKVMYGPALTPALQTDVLGYVTLVLYVKAEELGEEGSDTEFRALTKPQGRFRAKDRLDVLPRVLVNPRFDKIVQYVNGSIDETDDIDQIRRAERLAAEAEAKTAEAAKSEIASAGAVPAGK